MSATFERLVMTQNSGPLTDYLDNYHTCINPQHLNAWFHQAARLPGNYETNRNVWLQEYYEKYVPDDIRKGVRLTDQRLFPCLPEAKIPPAPSKDQRVSRLIPAIQQCQGNKTTLI